MRGLNGPISPSPATTRLQSFSLAAARARFEPMASALGLDGKAKLVEAALALTNGVDVTGWWLKITSSTALTNGKFDYPVEIYELALTTTAEYPKLDGLVGVKARNARETDNTSTVQCGYTITPGSTTCGDYIGVKPVGPGRVKCEGYEQVTIPGAGDGSGATKEWRLVFCWQNEAKIAGVDT